MRLVIIGNARRNLYATNYTDNKSTAADHDHASLPFHLCLMLRLLSGLMAAGDKNAMSQGEWDMTHRQPLQCALQRRIGLINSSLA